MNEGLFKAQLNEGWLLLCSLGLDGYRNHFPRYPDNPGALFRRMTYHHTWEMCFAKMFYDFQLFDNSLIQFRIVNGATPSYNYSYYECPYSSMTYNEFLGTLDASYDESGDEFRQDYEAYLSSCDLKDAVTPIRYDYNPGQYVEGRHPASHLHLGFFSNIRLSTKKILKPLSFLLLIIRQCYPEVWSRIHERTNADILCRNIRISLEDVSNDYCNPLDLNEMILQ